MTGPAPTSAVSDGSATADIGGDDLATSARSAHRRDGDSERTSQQASAHRHVAAPTFLQQRALAAIRFYQRSREGRLSPCRFFPSCSAYGHEAFEVHGTWRGGLLTARRLLRCRPLGPSGVDLVPERDPDDRGRTIDTGAPAATSLDGGVDAVGSHDLCSHSPKKGG